MNKKTINITKCIALIMPLLVLFGCAEMGGDNKQKNIKFSTNENHIKCNGIIYYPGYCDGYGSAPGLDTNTCKKGTNKHNYSYITGCVDY